MAITTFAAIDIGSYDTSLKIYEISKKYGLKEIDHVRYRLELGKESYMTGKIDSPILDELCKVLTGFCQIMEEFQVSDYRICSTSALREIKNSELVVEQIYRRTGMRVDILSNSEQRFIGYKSIAAMETGFKKMIQKSTAILDVGGGSVQVSLFDNDTLVTTQNIKIGSLRIRERLKNLEKDTTHYDQLIEEFIRHDLLSFQRLFLKDKEIKNVILVGDFLTDTIFHADIRDQILTRREFMNRYEAMAHKSSDALAAELGIAQEYASLVVPTVVIYKGFLDILGAESLWTPGVSLTDGIAYDFGEKNKLLKTKHNFENDILVAAANIGKRYSSEKSHIQGTTQLALGIFDGMKKIHGMSIRERLLLQLAAILHDCGKYISMENVAQCSYDIIMSTEIIGLSNREREIIANVVLYNTSEFYCYEEMRQKNGMDKAAYVLMAKLTAILRLANAMDRSHYQKVEGLKVVLKGQELQVVVDSSRDFSLEMGLLRSQSDFFHDIYGVYPVLKRRKKI